MPDERTYGQITAAQCETSRRICDISLGDGEISFEILLLYIARGVQRRDTRHVRTVAEDVSGLHVSSGSDITEDISGDLRRDSGRDVNQQCTITDEILSGHVPGGSNVSHQCDIPDDIIRRHVTSGSNIDQQCTVAKEVLGGYVSSGRDIGQ